MPITKEEKGCYSMFKLLSSAIGAISGIIALVRQLTAKKEPVRPTKEQQLEKDVHDARAASASLDTDTVNSITERNRVKNKLLLPVIIVTAGLASGCGCSMFRGGGNKVDVADPVPPKVVVVDTDMYQHPITNDVGTVGWFVPLRLHTEYMELQTILLYYRKENTRMRELLLSHRIDPDK